MGIWIAAAAMALAAITTGAPAAQSDDGVRRAVEEHYFKAHASGSGDPLKGMFIEEGRMMWVQDGQLRVRTSGEYIAGFSGKPAADEAKRRRRVVMTDVTGDVAVAKVELDHPDMLITDYFTLMRLGGDWKIVHKAFHRRPKR